MNPNSKQKYYIIENISKFIILVLYFFEEVIATQRIQALKSKNFTKICDKTF